MTEDEFVEMCHRMLNPPKPTPKLLLTYEEQLADYHERLVWYYRAVEQLRKSEGNLGSYGPCVPDALKGMENVGGGNEHCVFIPKPVPPKPPAG